MFDEDTLLWKIVRGGGGHFAVLGKKYSLVLLIITREPHKTLTTVYEIWIIYLTIDSSLTHPFLFLPQCLIKTPLSSLKQFLTTESSLKMMIFEFLSWNLWRHRLGSKYLHYTYCPLSQGAKAIQAIKFDQLIKYYVRNIFLEKYIENSKGD